MKVRFPIRIFPFLLLFELAMCYPSSHNINSIMSTIGLNTFSVRIRLLSGENTPTGVNLVDYPNAPTLLVKDFIECK